MTHASPHPATPLDLHPPVIIALLGAFRLQLEGDLAPIKSDSNAERLLVDLALHRTRRVPGAHLLALLWPDADLKQGRQSLHSLTYQLNRLADEALSGRALVEQKDGFYKLGSPEDIVVDIDLFDACDRASRRSWRQGDVEAAVAASERAVRLYRGDLCGCSELRATIERERLRVRCLEIHAHLAEHHLERGAPVEALRAIAEMLVLDPCREDAHRQAMRCHVLLGQRSQALRQFRLCEAILADEFDAKPEVATVALFDRIRRGDLAR